MLATTAAPAILPSHTFALESAGWQHLDISHRIARVIDRVRLEFGEDRVSDKDFARAVETCDLSKDELESNLGAASRIVALGAPQPAYSRTARVQKGAALVLGLMPDAADVLGVLRSSGFGTREVGDLWDEIVAKAADDFHADRAPDKAPSPMPDFARDMLSTNAE
jgi:hypothetical protein